MSVDETGIDTKFVTHALCFGILSVLRLYAIFKVQG